MTIKPGYYYTVDYFLTLWAYLNAVCYLKEKYFVMLALEQFLEPFPSRYSLVALLIPGLPIDAIGRHLPSIGHILTNLLRVTVPLTPLTVRLRCEAHRVLLTCRRIF